MAQIVELHFPDPSIAPSPVAPTPRTALARAASVRSSLSAEFDALRVKSPSEMWGRVLRGVKGAKAEDIRGARRWPAMQR
jgi:hypothetical protein